MILKASVRSRIRTFILFLFVFFCGAAAGGFAWKTNDARGFEARLILRGLAKLETQRNEAVRALVLSPEVSLRASDLSPASRHAIATAYETAFASSVQVLRGELARTRSSRDSLDAAFARVAIDRAFQAGEVQVSLPRVIFEVPEIESFPVVSGVAQCRRRVLFLDSQNCPSCRAALAALLKNHTGPLQQTCVHHVVVPSQSSDTLNTSVLAFCLGREAPAALKNALVSSADPLPSELGAAPSAALRIALEKESQLLLSLPSDLARVHACTRSPEVVQSLEAARKIFSAAAIHTPAVVSNTGAVNVLGSSSASNSSRADAEDILAWTLKD
jgi:hypothetical protein